MLTIGAFSQLSRVSARMLRHYDALGLLRPAHRSAETAYRYYDVAQLSTLAKIERLKAYGFPLSEIAALLQLAPGELARRVQRRRVEAYRELDALRATLRRMEEDIHVMEGTDMLNDSYHVIVMEAPAQRVFALRETIPIGQTHALFQRLYAAMEARGLRRAGAAQLLFLGDEFNYESMDVEAQAEAAGEDPGVKTIPARLYAATTHTGPYESVKFAYDALCAWLAEHPEYRVCGPAVERYLKDEEEARSPEELETGVLFPVERIG